MQYPSLARWRIGEAAPGQLVLKASAAPPPPPPKTAPTHPPSHLAALQRRPAGNDVSIARQCWDDSDTSTYKLRALDYMRTKVKVRAGALTEDGRARLAVGRLLGGWPPPRHTAASASKQARPSMQQQRIGPWAGDAAPLFPRPAHSWHLHERGGQSTPPPPAPPGCRCRAASPSTAWRQWTYTAPR